MKFHIYTDDLKVVWNTKGPMLRFSVTVGLQPTPEEPEGFLWKTEGCLCRTVTKEDEDGNTYTEFVWSPPLQRFGTSMRQLNHATAGIYNGVMKCLEEQGAIAAYKKRLAEFAISAKPGAQNVPETEEVGTYIVG